jgi:hypothetical protein
MVRDSVGESQSRFGTRKRAQFLRLNLLQQRVFDYTCSPSRSVTGPEQHGVRVPQTKKEPPPVMQVEARCLRSCVI